MNGEEHRALASLLLDHEAARTEMVLRSLIASPAGGARVCTSLVDVLLSFDLRGARPSPVTRDALLRAAFDHQHLLPVWTPHQRLLQVLLVRVLGCDPEAIEITVGDALLEQPTLAVATAALVNAIMLESTRSFLILTSAG